MARTVTMTEGWLARDDAALAGVLPRITGIVAERGEGSWLIDADGRRFLDFSSGIAVTVTGHCHPRVVAAIERQARTLIHTSVVAHHQPAVELAERMGTLVPFLDDPQVFFCNSGAEAVDGALKLARRTTGRGGVICFSGAFHGRTLAATSLTTAKPRYQQGYDPLLPGVHVAPYAYPLRDGGDDAATSGALAALDELLDGQAGVDAGCMIVEPVLGEGGYVVPPRAWLAGLRTRCDARGILLVFDEVQTGIGRTGRPFAAETFGVRPDVLVFAKAVASGMPLGGIVAGRSLMERWPTGAHGSTFGGNPVACAAALATLDVLADDGLCERAVALGRRVLDVLGGAAAASGAVREVRGVGLMIGVELVDASAAKAVQQACLAEDLIVLTCGPGDNVLRLIPPLTISEDDLDLGLAILTSALAAV